MTIPDDFTSQFTWTSALDLTVRGLGWRNEEREQPFDRLPAAMKDLLPEDTWRLGTYCSGLAVDFRSAARSIALRWQVDGSIPLAQDPYMAASGIGGVDLYGRDGGGAWRWCGALEPFGEPDAAHGKITKLPLDGVDREYRLYLPLMRRLLSLDIGADAPVSPAAADARAPILYYGTSIVHGAGVSRPGCGHAQLLERALDLEVLNLGFCGRARCETAKAELFARQKARMILLDPLPNNGASELAERLPPFLEILLEAHGDIPVLFVEERLHGDAAFQPQRGEECRAKNQMLQKILLDFRGKGHRNLHLVQMGSYYGEDGSTDGNHPNDLGAYRLFERLLPAVNAHL